MMQNLGQQHQILYIEDVAGNIDDDYVFIIKKLPSGEEGFQIPGYHLTLLITIIGIISTVVLIQLKRNLKKK